MAKQNQKFNSVDSLLAGTERLFLLLLIGLLPVVVALFAGLVGQPGHHKRRKREILCYGRIDAGDFDRYPLPAALGAKSL